MPRMVKDARIETRAARARIAVADSVRSKGHEPQWRAIGEGEHLGYRKEKHGGKWIVRHRKHGAYIKKLLGKGDGARGRWRVGSRLPAGRGVRVVRRRGARISRPRPQIRSAEALHRRRRRPRRCEGIDQRGPVRVSVGPVDSREFAFDARH